MYWLRIAAFALFDIAVGWLWLESVLFIRSSRILNEMDMYEEVEDDEAEQET